MQVGYDFKNLSDPDFEDLARDLLGRELGVRFEAFTQGKDSGLDGRHSSAIGQIILQAKHYADSPSSALVRTMKRERSAIDRLNAGRYILATTCRLTPTAKTKIASAIGPSLNTEDDIVGPDDLNGLLRRYPDVEKSHLKLWLSSSAVLQRILNAASHSYNAMALEEIADRVRIYAPNPSFDLARKMLDDHHLLIVAGPPGVGKTTLAEMVVYAHLAEDWELVAIRSLEDGLASINDGRRQIFYFDDFLGRVALDKHALGKMDSDLARFIKRVKRSPHARFVLTTRAPIFEEAKRHSEYLADPQLDISKYLLDVGVYTRRIKARILYNHLVAAGTPQTHVDALIESKKLPKIIDHKNYNPRLVALMTEGSRISSYVPSDYPDRFVAALDNPKDLWDLPFRKHIPKTCQNLLMTLFFSPEFGVSIENLREAYQSFHIEVCKHYGCPLDPKDFEDALEILEGGFIKIRGSEVSFVNPSVKDYLSAYLEDPTLLGLAASAARRTDWAMKVWQHVRSDQVRRRTTASEIATIVMNFRKISDAFLILPVHRRVPSGSSYSIVVDGISNTDRIELLAHWYLSSGDSVFIEIMKKLAADPVDGWDGWRDGGDLIAVVAKLRNEAYFGSIPGANDIAQTIEEGLIELILGYSLNSEDLVRLLDAEEEWTNEVSDEVSSALLKAIHREFRDVEDAVRNIDSDSHIDEHVESLTRMAKRASVSDKTLQDAIDVAEARRAQIYERPDGPPSSSGRGFGREMQESFDDSALNNLFAPLWRGQR
nr:restriction endonuclease [Agrobacterium fabrum]